MTSTFRSKMGAALMMPSLKNFKKKMDYTEYGGAPLLGVNKAIVKAHGSSNSKAFYHAIRQCRQMCMGDVVGIIREEIQALPRAAWKSRMCDPKEGILMFEQVQKVIAEQLNIDPANVKPESKLVEDLKRIRWTWWSL